MSASILRKCLALMGLAVSIGVANSAPAQSTSLDHEVSELENAWAAIQYQTPESEHAAKFEVLANQARHVTQHFPQSAESHIWDGIVLSSWAGAKGGIGALGIAKQAKAQFETAIQIDPNALGGSALDSLGVLYYKVPDWPLGFGNNSQAETLLKQALAVNPNGIDSNYFYADYLFSRKRYAEAIPYLNKAIHAPSRLGREIADAGRRDDAEKLLARIRAEATK